MGEGARFLDHEKVIKSILFYDMAVRRKKDTDYYIVDSKTGCWNFSSYCESARGGYGRMYYRGSRPLAHRYFYERYKGKIGEGLQIDHLCRNTKCVNPEHLEAVSQKENIHRSRVAKLDREKVEEIRQRYGTGETQRSLARCFGVGQDQISRIVNLIQWV